MVVSAIEEMFLRTSSRLPSFRIGKDEELERILFDVDYEEAFDIDAAGIQSSCSVQNVRKARALASVLVNDSGMLQVSKVRLAKEILEKGRHSIAYGAEDLRARDLRLLKALTLLSENIEAQRLIKKMSRPLVNRLAEIAIRHTLLLPDTTVVTDVHARRAVVAALCTTLRQSLGSCFATAPAIVVHEDQPLQFLRDLDELIGTAKLKRVIAGNEYSVPMSSSSGNGDLQKTCFLEATLDLSPPIWRSSPTVRALQSIEILPQGLSREEGYAKLRALIEKVVPKRPILLSMDDLFLKIILHHVGLSAADIDAYEHRPKALVQTSMIVTAPSGTRADKDKQYIVAFDLLEKVRRAFVGEADCALLKSWEFTIASFAESSFDLTRWNFYSSLGVNWDDEGGIGQVLNAIAKSKVDETNLELEQYRERYDAICVEIDYLKRRLESASTEDEMRWMKMEFQTRQAEQYHIKQVYDMMVEKTNKIANVHQFLIDSYEKLMKEYFQEVYDPDLHDVKAGPYDDSPAGFRLLYKHGRTNPSLWTKIYSLPEYIEALVSFFTITEQELLHSPEIQGIESEFSAIITRLANHVRSDQFIESALARTAIAHGVRPIADAMHHLDQIEKKPWVFTSGGNMNSLVSAYFGLEGPPEESERWVENETELLAFLIDTARQANNRSPRFRPTSLLMHSPTHAFSCLPTISPVEEVIRSDAYSYSWITTHVRDPFQLFWSTCVLDARSVQAFCAFLAERLPADIQKRFLNEAPTIGSFLRPFDLAKEIQKLFSLDIVLRHSLPILDQISLEGLLFESVPYINPDVLRETVVDLLKAVLPRGALNNGADQKIKIATTAINRPLRSKELLCLLKTLILTFTGATRCEKDLLASLVTAMRERRLLPPEPVIIADSNWVKEYFAFLVSPVSQQIEFWMVNNYGTEGRSIPYWKPWLDGSRKDRTWGVLVNPLQYRKV